MRARRASNATQGAQRAEAATACASLKRKLLSRASPLRDAAVPLVGASPQSGQKSAYGTCTCTDVQLLGCSVTGRMLEGGASSVRKPKSWPTTCSFCNKFNVPNKIFSTEIEKLNPLFEDGIVDLFNNIISVTETGRPFVRLVAAAFDAYLDSGKGRHSRAV